MPAPGNAKSANPCSQTGWITLEGGFAARPCVVQDISSAGAKITADGAARCPARCGWRLRVTRTGRNCQVIWRRGNSFGVKFIR